MKFIGKLLVYLLVALLIVLLALYILLQTRWGASQVSSWVTVNTDYELSFDKMNHRFSSPSHIILENVTFGRDGKPATLVAKKVDIGLSSRQITDPLHMDTITLFDGTLNLSPQTAPLPFQADRLQLNNMAFNSPNTEWDLSAQKVTGGVSPWQPEAGNVLGNNAQIQMSAGSLTLNGVPATNVLIEGQLNGKEVVLKTIGADMARGSLTGSALRNADGSWIIDTMRLNEIRLQSDKTLMAFFAPLATIPLCRLVVWT
jgi:hypothetical protein